MLVRLGNLSWYPNNDRLLITEFYDGVRYYNEDKSISWIKSVNINDRSVGFLAKFDGDQQYLRPKLSPDG